jgi:CheY-like chemotaxis protein
VTASVLVVEDDPDLRTALATALQDDGYAVRTAGNGRDALTQHQAAPADLIVTDLMMPVMTGAELIAALRAAGDLTPMLLVTAVAMTAAPEVIAVAARHPAVAILAKPFDLIEFFTLVERILGG